MRSGGRLETMARVRWKNRDGTENLAEGTEGEGLEAQTRGRLGRNWKPG